LDALFVKFYCNTGGKGSLTAWLLCSVCCLGLSLEGWCLVNIPARNGWLDQDIRGWRRLCVNDDDELWQEPEETGSLELTFGTPVPASGVLPPPATVW